MKQVIGIIGAVVLIGGYSAFDYFTGNELGEPCIYNTDCVGNLSFQGVLDIGAQCLQDEVSFYCTTECGDTADCPAGWTCEIVYVTENGVETGKTNNVCARPVPGAQPQAMPGQAAPVAGQAMPAQAAPVAVPQPVAQPAAQ